MTPIFILHTLYLGFAIILTFIWSNDPNLSVYDLQLTGALVLLYFVFRMINTARRSQTNNSFVSTIILTVISLLLVFSTGGLGSPLFFILNFLLFALALLFEPIQAATTSLILIALFIWQNYLHLSTENLVNIASLGLMSPIAIVFSRTYLSNLESGGKIRILRQVVKEEELESLLWISKTAKPSLSGVLNSVTDIVMYFNSKGNEIPTGLVMKLRTIQKDLIALYSSTGTLEKTLKETSDKADI